MAPLGSKKQRAHHQLQQNRFSAQGESKVPLVSGRGHLGEGLPKSQHWACWDAHHSHPNPKRSLESNAR